MKNEILGVGILAGGNSRRMGRDKVSIEIEGKSLLSMVLEKVEPLKIPVKILSGKRIIPNMDCLLDEEGEGPLAGLLEGLKIFSRVLILPVDMPFLSTDLLSFLLHQEGGHDILTCQVRDALQPQVGVYSKSCLSFAKKNLAKGDCSLKGLLSTPLIVKVIRESELTIFGDPELMFLNINTPEDLEKATNKMNRRPRCYQQ